MTITYLGNNDKLLGLVAHRALCRSSDSIDVCQGLVSEVELGWPNVRCHRSARWKCHMRREGNHYRRMFIIHARCRCVCALKISLAYVEFYCDQILNALIYLQKCILHSDKKDPRELSVTMAVKCAQMFIIGHYTCKCMYIHV